ncbi:alpha-L RNA-binding motif-containing protein [Thelephora ganbajun]|uniref:Alpha-L RNA-binding motif-containing protein n=1 Tax=Thelephora ganbajun TaxID=370292 RepID=A0ACB6ZWR9_THEGA|nr:alpha-L RNA-binding motif-containing protein [Thelephora ganbajun]
MRDVNLFNFKRALPRMSWNPKNLYNLWRRSLGAKVSTTDYTRTTKTLFQQRWAAKQLVRAYHGDYINEKTFKRWYLPANLPDVRPTASVRDDSLLLTKWANKTSAVEKEIKRREEEASKGLAPVGSLMFSEVERRIDVVIFRSCLAHSVYEARRMVVHGNVLLNGQKHQNANTRLAPGDMVTVDPKAINFLQPRAMETDPDEGADADTHPSKDVSSAIVKSADGSTSGHTPFHLPNYAAPFIFIPTYLEVSFPTCSTVYLRHPTARPGYSEVPTPYDADGEVVRLAWEWYAKVRPRMRSKRQLARMPENRQ